LSPSAAHAGAAANAASETVPTKSCRRVVMGFSPWFSALESRKPPD
jgi:hypothetical protein